MFNSDNIPFLETNLDDKTVTPLSVDGLSTESSAPTNNQTKPQLDLNRELVKNPASTFFARIRDDSMENEGNLLIIDKSTKPYNECLVVAFVDSEFILKRIKIEGDTTWLVSARQECKPIRIDADNEHIVWGVVKYLIKKI